MLQAHATGMAAAEGRKRPDFVLKLYRMLKECPELITWENGLIVMPSPAKLERVLCNYFRHGKFTSFQRQLNNFGFRKYAEAGKGTCVYVRDDLSGLPAEALLDLRRKPGLGDDDDGAGANGGGWAVLDPSSAMAARYSAHAGGGGLPPGLPAATAVAAAAAADQQQLQAAALHGLLHWRRRWRVRRTRVSLEKRRRRAPKQPGKVTHEKEPQSFAAARYIFAATPSSHKTCV